MHDKVSLKVSACVRVYACVCAHARHTIEKDAMWSFFKCNIMMLVKNNKQRFLSGRGTLLYLNPLAGGISDIPRISQKSKYDEATPNL